MNTYIRTTITLPNDLYEQLRLAAYRGKTSVSGIIQKKLSAEGNKKKNKKSVLDLAGTYNLKGKEFNRKDYYGAVIVRDMALGH